MGDELKLVRYITEQVVTYIETPKQERQRVTKVKEPWSTKWFGMIPISLSLWRRNARIRHKDTDAAEDPVELAN